MRISPFDNQSRRQTSFADVEVLPVVETTDHLDVDENDIRTSMSPGAPGTWGKPADIAGDILQQEKELANVIVNGSAQWWFDVSHIVFTNAALMARMATLTPQQVRVLMMLSEGLLNKQIAYQLGVSEATVKAHVSAILQKLGVESRTQAVIAAAKIEAGHFPQGAGMEG